MRLLHWITRITAWYGFSWLGYWAFVIAVATVGSGPAAVILLLVIATAAAGHMTRRIWLPRVARRDAWALVSRGAAACTECAWKVSGGTHIQRQIAYLDHLTNQHSERKR